MHCACWDLGTAHVKKEVFICPAFRLRLREQRAGTDVFRHLIKSRSPIKIENLSRNLTKTYKSYIKHCEVQL